ncbi:response regulator [Dissulfurirhabdus thermomarina]|uniref:histidine kinase n=1 Tax=Dissulfurirhabdus thermomarina TaxID=1765737 RepID=A0A6N9TPW4_DISTH|nr:ATP-binding protein [Dissulfurirhabdus thermomarina]NDY41487.1 response regulator [Dissulfurirhabdus thermomarina]NMX23886.1 response regulator [Dissulfurirhabdus thermomarina]
MKEEFLHKLMSASTEIISTTDVKGLYRKITSIMQDFLRLDFSTVMTLSDDKRHLVIRDTLGFPASMIDSFSLVEGQGLSTWVVRNRRAAITPDFRRETRFEVPPVVFEEGISSAICVPMMLGDEVFGVFIGHTRERRDFTREEVYFCQTIGNQAAVAIQNALNMLAVTEAEERYREIFHNANDALFLVEMVGERVPGRFIDANDVACRMYGYDRGELLSLTLRDVTAPGGRQELEERLRDLARAGRSVFEVDHVTRDGRVFPVEISAHVFSLEGRETLLLVGRDVSERRRSEEEKRQLEAQLHQAQKMESIGRLAGGIAHDFNNLLSAVLGYCELLLLKVPEEAPFREEVEAIRAAGEKAATLTRQLLAFSRKQVLEVKPLHMNRVIDGIVQLLGKILGEDIEIEVRLAAEGDVVEADQGQLEQVFMNLAVNARDAMPGGGRLIIETLEVRLDEAYALAHPGVRPGAYVMVAVTDFGVGMPKDVLEHIFDPFFTTKERGKGTGLGLSMVHGVVRQHNGYINVYSEVGRGTTFKIFFPRCTEAPAAEERAEGEGAVCLQGTETILVVDDEPSIRELVVATLEPFGYKCLAASCGAEALGMLEAMEPKPQLVLTDVIMPGMNGRELAERLRAEMPSLKVVFMSGYTDNAIVHHGVLEDNVRFIQKPVTPSVLLRKIREALDG